MHLKFVADAMVAHLARWLRVMGYDVLDHTQCGEDDAEILECARSTGRVIITRDEDLHARAVRVGLRSLLLRSGEVEQALAWIAHETGIDLSIDLSRTRCPLCNSPLVRVPSVEAHGAPDYVRERYSDVYVCESCGKIYWPGSHFTRMQATLARAREALKKLKSGESRGGTGR